MYLFETLNKHNSRTFFMRIDLLDLKWIEQLSTGNSQIIGNTAQSCLPHYF